ncbi:MAG: hypothetical protein AB8B99_07490 [Phormidesmis sp.]
MKLPATESKGDRLTASKIQAPVQASVRQLARTLASIAPTQTPKSKTPKEKVAREKAAREKIAREKIAKRNSPVENAASKTDPEQNSLEKPAPEKAAKAKTPHPEKVSEAKSVSRSSPVPNLPFINKDSKAVRVTFTLLLVRPWVLVAGLWLVALLGSAAAIQGLIRPKVLMQALPEAVVEAPPVLTSSIINVADGDIEGGNIESSATTESEAAAQADTLIEATNDGGFPVWTVSALVGTCAAGCLVMSRRRAMARMSAARSAARARGRVRRKPVAANAVRTVDTVKSLKQVRKPVTVGSADAERKELSRVKKRRQRNRRATAPMTGSQAAVAKGRKANHKPSRPVKAGQKLGQSAQGGRVLVSRSTAQKAHANVNPTRVRRVKKTSSRTARRQAMVSVVPASESHALDWRNGSLAHQMDVRPQRRAAM